MSVDWSKYPPLPKPPKLPEWRDTPEHEAYWEEVDAITTPFQNKWGCLGVLLLWLLVSALLCQKFVYFRHADVAGVFFEILIACTVGYCIILVPCVICNNIFYRVAKHKISKRYGFSLKKLNRPDISKEIGEVLAARPDFDKLEFSKYWQNKEQSEIALKILELSKGEWYLHKKMLYPNDPLLLFFYGKKSFLGKERMINDAGEFFEDIEDEFYFYECNEINEGISFAEFVERCIAAKREKTAIQGNIEKDGVWRMSVDWSKYPPLPKPPKLPEWRDTPEHEAYWEEVEDIRTPLQTNWGCGGMFALWILSAAIFNHWLWGNNWDDIFTRIITGGTVGFFAALVPYVICHKIFYWVAKRKISKRYGFSIRKLNRPDISDEIGKVLSARPDFNETEFCKYWQNAEQAINAFSVLLSTRNYWCLHKKMLYPNDPLLLLFYGRQWRIFCQWRWGVGKEKMIEPDIEFYLDCVWCYLDVFDRDRFYEESKILYSRGTTLAEFLEICEEMKKKEAMYQ